MKNILLRRMSHGRARSNTDEVSHRRYEYWPRSLVATMYNRGHLGNGDPGRQLGRMRRGR